jgi:peroxiredoxin
MRRLAVLAVLLGVFVASAFAEVKVGDAAPDFALKDQDGNEVRLSSYRGKKNVLLAFYPADFSSSCTREIKCFARDFRKVQARDFVVLAVSVDPVESHAKFASTVGAKFPLLSDPDLAVAKLYDVAAPSATGGSAVRSAFLVDKEGKLRWLDRNLKAPDSLDGCEILAQMDKIGGTVDPAAALAELPPAEREGKTVLVRFVQALLAEDIRAVDALLDPEACGRTGETAQMQRDRRKGFLERFRTLFDKNDLSSLKFADVVDVAKSRVLAKTDVTPAALASFGADAREMAQRLAEGELLVVGRTSAPKLGDTQVLSREVVLRLRKSGDSWRILEVVP